MSLSIEPTESALGAVVKGVDMGRVPDPDIIESIETALEQYGVLIFPGQDITPAQQTAFSAALAPLEMTANIDARLDGQPEIFVVGNTGAKPVTFAPKFGNDDLEWHTDHIHRPEPARASLLYAKEIPAEGGDTLFACMYSAYDDLAAEQKAQYGSLTAIHSVAGLRNYLREQSEEEDYDPGRQADMPESVSWPLVRHHPRTGRPALYFGAKVTIGIEGWAEETGLAFIRDLSSHATRPEFVYRHVWRHHDAVLWDNRRVLHAATPFDMTRNKRLMHRTTLRETEPVH